MDSRHIDSLKYKDEADKCLGAAGMAIAVVALDGSAAIASMDIDAAPDEMIEFMPEFYFEGNPRLMASASWRRLLHNFSLTTGLLIGNVLCRRMVGGLQMPSDAERQYLRDIVVQEGTETCELEEDEADNLFANNYDRMSRLFMRRSIHSMAHEFASIIRDKRRLSRLELLQNLQSLQML